MATYDHQCTDKECNNTWEDSYSIHAAPPTTCPKCHKETAKRIITFGTAGKVELAGRELQESIKSDADSMKREMRTNENMYANLLGESRYQTMKSNYDKSRR
jgi:putative FmdB family regulatory protein